MRFLISPGSCSFEVMPGTLRNICMSVSLLDFQAGSVSSSIGTSARQDLSAALLVHPQCLGVSWTVLCTGGSGFDVLRRFLVGCARFVCRG